MFIFKEAPRVTRRRTIKALDPQAAETMRRLNEYLNKETPELVEWVFRRMQDQQAAFTYKELREAALNGFESQIHQWQEEYAEMINALIAPEIELALERGAAERNLKDGDSIIFDSSDRRVQEYLRWQTGALITNIGEETRRAVRAVIARGQQEGWSSDELARKIRPTIGLTTQQTVANLNYQITVYNKLLQDNPTMRAATAEKRAREAGMKYAAKQHRYRAQMIADTELAMAYNAGAHESVRQAMERGLMGTTVEVWSTARDERTCPSCGSLNGVTVGFDASWDGVTGNTGEPVKWGSKSSSRTPPAHPNCRCVILYRETGAPRMPKTPGKPKNSLQEPAVSDIMDPTAKEFKPARNRREAEDYTRKVLGIPNVSYKGCDLETINEWNRGLFDNIRQFPKLKENMRFVGECHERNRMAKAALVQSWLPDYRKKLPNLPLAELIRRVKKAVDGYCSKLKVGKNVYAQSFSSKEAILVNYKGVTVNDNWGGNAAKFRKSLEKDTKMKWHPVGCGTIRSVLDHEIGHQLDVMLDISKMPEVVQLFSKTKMDDITNALSEYSWNNKTKPPIKEFIAEAWAEYCNTQAPRRPMAQKIGDIIITEYNKKYGGGKR